MAKANKEATKMADLFKMDQTRSFISAWQAHYAGRETYAQGFFGRVAAEQRANLESIKRSRKSTGRAPTWCSIEEYEQCVELLEAAGGEGPAGLRPGDMVRPNHRGEDQAGHVIDHTRKLASVVSAPYHSGGRSGEMVVDLVWIRGGSHRSTNGYPVAMLEVAR